jgi:hypothetical protein
VAALFDALFDEAVGYVQAAATVATATAAR